MKTRATLLLLWVSLGLWAQAPDNFKYQAVLRDASGNVKANTATTIVLSMLEGSVSGSLVYAETHAVTTNEFGLVNLTVGNGTNKTGTLAAIDWSANSYFLNVKVDGTDFGTSQLMSVPYALYAKTAGNGFSGNYNDLTNKPAAATVTETGLMSPTDKTKLDGIAAGAEVNVNADWTATTGDGLILNKPILFSGSFADLTSKPTTISGYGITDAFSGSYNNLTDKPSFTSPLVLNAGTVSISPDGITSAYIASSAITGSEIADRTIAPIDLANATSVGQVLKYTAPNTWAYSVDNDTQYSAGSGLSLTGTTFSLSAPVSVANGGTGAATLTGVLIGNGTGALTGVTHSGANQYLRRNSTNTAYEFGTLAPVAGSGNYNDLSNRPTLLNSSNFSTATGFEALKNNSSTGSYNTANGYQSLYSNTFGDWNTANGYNSLYSNTEGNSNTANGFSSLYSNTTGQFNTANGSLSLNKNITGSYNTANGYQALYSNTTGSGNTAMGGSAGWNNTIGSNNTAIGQLSLNSNVANSRSTAVGAGAMAYANNGTTGYDTYNTAVGVNALRGSTTPANNTGIHNTAIGDQTLLVNNFGSGNTAVGEQALGATTSGNNNTAIGYEAGINNTTGSNNIFIGNYAQGSTATVSNQITLGNTFITSLRCAVQSISSLSDRRDKRDIQDLSVGLDFLMQLKPRQFYWDKREWYEGNYSDGSLMQSKPTAGFIAQELDETQQQVKAEWLNLVLKDNPEKLEATYGNLLPVMVKAIQEQQQQIEKLKAENAQLKSELEQRLQKLEALLTTNHN